MSLACRFFPRLLLILCAEHLIAQGRPPDLRFEVASIRPAPDPATLLATAGPGKPPHIGTKIDGQIVDMGSASLMRLFCDAYSIHSIDRVSGPDWMETQRFDVLAKLPAGATKDQLPELLQTLLTERFHLAFHRTNNPESAYVLVVGSKGPRLEPAIPDDSTPDAKAGPPRPAGFGQNPATFSGIIRGGPFGTQRTSVENGVVHSEYYGITAEQLAEVCSGYLGRPVLDMTGLDGKYHVVFENAVSEMASAGSTDRGAWIITAVDKSGLKLESRKIPVEKFVIDHIEKMPTEN